MYKPRKLIQGWRLGDQKGKLPRDYINRRYIAIPEKKFCGGRCMTEFESKFMSIDKLDALFTLDFPDKYGKKEFYTLYYYEWKPEKELILF